MDQASLQPLRALPVPLRGGSNHLRRWLARERAKAMQPRYVATMVIETTFLSRLYVIGGTRV
jgi:hypothetical protein